MGRMGQIFTDFRFFQNEEKQKIGENQSNPPHPRSYYYPEKSNVSLKKIDIPLDALLQGDESLGALDALNFLDFVVQNLPEVKCIFANDFCKNGVQTGGVVGIYDFGDFAELPCNVIVQ